MAKTNKNAAQAKGQKNLFSFFSKKPSEPAAAATKKSSTAPDSAGGAPTEKNNDTTSKPPPPPALQPTTQQNPTLSHPSSNNISGAQPTPSQLKQLQKITVGTKLEVYWPDDQKYYPCVVTRHRVKADNGDPEHMYTINHEDGEIETVDLSKEKFRIIGGVKQSSDGTDNTTKAASAKKDANNSLPPPPLSHYTANSNSSAMDMDPPSTLKNLPSWDDIGPPENGNISIWVRTIRGKCLLLSVKPSDRIDVVRSEYCATHGEWKGYIHPLINFINEKSHFFMRGDRPLSEMGVVHGTILLLVVGDDLRHTGGIELPPTGIPPNPPKDIYRVENHPTSANGNSANPGRRRTVRATIPGWMDVPAVVNSHEGTASVIGNTIIHDASLGCTYNFAAIIPSEFLRWIDEAEESLISAVLGPIDRRELSSRLSETKIGQAQDLQYAFDKLRNFRSCHPHSLLYGVIVVHGNGAKNVERAKQMWLMEVTGLTNDERILLRLIRAYVETELHKMMGFSQISHAGSACGIGIFTT